MSYDINKANARNSRMWLRIAKLLEKAAYEAASQWSGPSAVRLGQLADWCSWQATGEGDAVTIKDILGGGEQP